jgi:transposase
MNYKIEKMSLKRTIQVANDPTLSLREAGLRSGWHASFIQRLRVMLKSCPYDLNAPTTYSESDLKRWVRSFDNRKKPVFHEPDFVAITKAIAAKQWSRKRAYSEYLISASSLPKMSSRTFYKRIEALLKQPKVVLRINHKPGEAMQLDFAGFKPKYLKHALKEFVFRELFVAVLGCSSYTFATSTKDQTAKEWLRAHIAALEFFEGSPRVWVPDNLKAAVLKPGHNGRAILNPSYRQLAEFYGAFVQPARPYRPTDKGRVEAAVKLVQNRLKESLDTSPVYSVEELDLRILEVVKEINEKPTLSFGNQSRRDLFLEIDKPALMPLPATPFEMFDVVIGKPIRRDYTVEFEGNYYSVDFSLAGKLAEIHASTTTVMIVSDGIVCATHPRLDGVGKRSVTDNHRPAHHKAMLMEDQDRLDAKLMENCVDTRDFVTTAIDLATKPHSRRSYIQLALNTIQSFKPDEVTEAVIWCNASGLKTITGLRDVLASGQWKRGIEIRGHMSAPLDAHIRGASYYDLGGNAGKGVTK